MPLVASTPMRVKPTADAAAAVSRTMWTTGMPKAPCSSSKKPWAVLQGSARRSQPQASRRRPSSMSALEGRAVASSQQKRRAVGDGRVVEGEGAHVILVAAGLGALDEPLQEVGRGRRSGAAEHAYQAPAHDAAFAQAVKPSDSEGSEEAEATRSLSPQGAVPFLPRPLKGSAPSKSSTAFSRARLSAMAARRSSIGGTRKRADTGADAALLGRVVQRVGIAAQRVQPPHLPTRASSRM